MGEPRRNPRREVGRPPTPGPPRGDRRRDGRPGGGATDGATRPPEDASDGALDAGPVAAWVDALGAARARPAGAGGPPGVSVPCGPCTACCRAAYFVPVEADETDTLAHVPRSFLTPAPGARDGTMLIVHDRSGACAMLRDGRCSVYEHRPRACRAYDCRVFAATGIAPDAAGEAAVSAQAARWRFATPTAIDRARLEAMRAAAAFLRDHPECLEPTHLGGRAAAASPVALPAGALALIAVAVSPLFLDAAGTAVVTPPVAEVTAAVAAHVASRAPDSAPTP